MTQKIQASERQRGRPIVSGQPDPKVQTLDTKEEIFAENGYAAGSDDHAGHICVYPPEAITAKKRERTHWFNWPWMRAVPYAICRFAIW